MTSTLAWTIGIMALLASTASFTMAALVYRARPQALQNRSLAVMLFMAAIILTAYNGIRWFGVDARTTHALAVVDWVASASYSLAYLQFLGTLGTPLSSWFLSRGFRLVSGLYFGWAMVSAVVWTPLWIGATAFDNDLGVWFVQSGPMEAVNGVGVLVLFLFAMVAAVSAFRRAEPGLAKRKAKWIVIGFVTADALIITGTLLEAFLPAGASSWSDAVAGFSYPLSMLGLTAFLGYGVLQAQLFDIQIRLRRGAVRVAGLGITVGTLLLVRRSLAGRVPDVALDALTVVALLALMVGLERLRRTTDRAFPVDRDDLDVRRYEVYQAALAERRDASGRVQDNAWLQGLRKRLGVTEHDHRLLAMTADDRAARFAMVPGARLLGRYRILKDLGQGRGEPCCLAKDEELGRHVVLKRVPDGETREAEALARLDHPNVVRLFDVVRTGTVRVLVMEHRTGGSLDQFIASGKRPEAMRLAQDLLNGLQALHRHGIIHGDIKPANVLLDETGRAAIADLGAVVDQDATATLDGPSMGTARFFSPERARGAPPSVQDDLWAVAATLHEATTGHPLIPVAPGASVNDVRIALAGWTGPGPGVPAWLHPALASDVAQRPVSAARFLDALRREHESGAAEADDVPRRQPHAAPAG